MPRQRRIEYAGAIYLLMARGDRREDIVHDEHHRLRFEETLAEVVDASGWVMHAWVLMRNHDHFVFRTPEPNLVEGMKWCQNTWTRRFNGRHRLWGHLFGGRYKAIPVEDGSPSGLQMGARNAVSRTIRAAKDHAQGNRAAARLAKKLEAAVK